MAFPASLDSFVAKVDNTDDVLAAHMNLVQTAIESIEAKLGVDSSAVATSLDYLLKSASSVDPGHLHSVYGNFITSGRKLWLYENTAPTGWTIVAVTDSVLAVKGGFQAYNVTGGQTAGTWTQPNHTHTMNTHNHQWYNHNTGADKTYNNAGAEIDVHTTGYAAANRIQTGNAQENSLVDSYTDKIDPGDTNNGATAATYRPLAAIGVIVSKDA